MALDVDNMTREALVYAPRISAGAHAKHPVIFAFHGHAGTMRSADKQMRLQRYWPGAIVVYMQGLPTPGIAIDPEGRQTGWQHLPGQAGDRDLKFFDAMLGELRWKYAIDDKRIYVAGFSNGAYFSYLLWAERASEIAALAICAGRIVEPIQLTMPRSLIAIAARKDTVVKFEQQMASIEIARRLAGAANEGIRCGHGCTTYEGEDGLAVTTLITNQGHSYPARASAMIAKFFETHALR